MSCHGQPALSTCHDDFVRRSADRYANRYADHYAADPTTICWINNWQLISTPLDLTSLYSTARICTHLHNTETTFTVYLYSKCIQHSKVRLYAVGTEDRRTFLSIAMCRVSPTGIRVKVWCGSVRTHCRAAGTQLFGVYYFNYRYIIRSFYYWVGKKNNRLKRIDKK